MWTTKGRHWRHADVFIANFEYISLILLVVLLLTLSKQILLGFYVTCLFLLYSLKRDGGYRGYRKTENEGYRVYRKTSENEGYIRGYRKTSENEGYRGYRKTENEGYRGYRKTENEGYRGIEKHQRTRGIGV